MIKILEPSLIGNERDYVNKCLDTNWISSQGEYVKEFESIVLQGHDRWALSTSSGTTALHLALVSFGIGIGDEIIVPDITFGATLNAIFLSGARPVIVDIDPDNWNISRDCLNQAITDKTKAILPVMLLGNPDGIIEVCKWAEKHDVLTIIDAAEAVGAKIHGKDIGGFGDAIIYSYFGNKTLTTGEGGAIIFKDEDIANLARMLRDHGMTPGKRYHHEVIGYNYRMTNIQAAIGVAQYERIDQILAHKAKVYSQYVAHLSDSPIQFQKCDENLSSSHWLFGALLPKGAILKVRQSLEIESIEYRLCFEPMSLQPAFQRSRVSGILDASKKLSENLIFLPSHANLTETDVGKVCKAVLKGIKSNA